MRHHVVWQIVAETVACVLNVEGNSYSIAPRVSIVVKIKVKESRDRSGVTQRVPRGLGSQIS
jgi:hypothetical protein